MELPEDPHYFIGIPAPSFVEEQLAKWQEILSPHVNYKRWMHPEDFHITLKFLGSVTEEKLRVIQEKLAALTVPSALQLQITGVNFFGKEDQPRVMYAEVAPNDALNHLHRVVEEEMEALGFDVERRPYRPHLTLAKKWAKDKLHFGADVLTNHLEMDGPIEYTANEMNLYIVKPTQEKKYDVITTYPLRT